MNKTLYEEILNLMPCIQSNCDKNGTLTEVYNNEPQPAPCQFCYQVRFPAAKKLQLIIGQHTLSARIDAVREFNKRLNSNHNDQPIGTPSAYVNNEMVKFIQELEHQKKELE